MKKILIKTKDYTDTYYNIIENKISIRKIGYYFCNPKERKDKHVQAFLLVSEGMAQKLCRKKGATYASLQEKKEILQKIEYPKEPKPLHENAINWIFQFQIKKGVEEGPDYTYSLPTLQKEELEHLKEREDLKDLCANKLPIEDDTWTKRFVQNEGKKCKVYLYTAIETGEYTVKDYAEAFRKMPWIYNFKIIYPNTEEYTKIINNKKLKYPCVDEDIKRRDYSPNELGLYQCPCCGKYTLPATFEYNVCQECGWEDQGVSNLYEPGDANGACLRQYQIDYEYNKTKKGGIT